MKSQAHRRVGLACGSFVWIVLGCAAAATAVPFAGGTGEPNDPYQIATAEQLVSIGSDPNLLSRHFVLVADINLDPNLPGGKVFTEAIIAPSSKSPFTGSLDGAGHVIHNLTINAISHAGLFGYVAEGATVKNLGLENASITGWIYVGGLAASSHGSLSWCHSTGIVTGEWFNVGGLVGDNDGTIISCHSSVGVSMAGEGTDNAGGLAGTNRGTVISCHSTGSVTSTGFYVGGLVGDNEGTMSSCYSTGSVTGWSAIGGLAGENGLFGTMTCCYSIGDVMSTEWAPGMVGGLTGSNRGIITSCYSTSSVNGSAEVAVGGLVGSNSGQMASSYFLAESDGGGPDNGQGTALIAGQMRQQGSFLGFDFWGSKTDGISDDWFMPPDWSPVLAWQTDVTGLQAIPDLSGLTLEEARGVLEQVGLVLATEVQTDYDRTMPQGHILRSYPPSYVTPGGMVEVVVSKGPYEWSANPGDGTEANPYQIQTANQLESLTDNPGLWSKHFVLTADIDLAGRTYSKALIAPDVDDSIDAFQGTAFTGSFDGQGFKILNLGIATAANDYLGLFGFIAKGALVRQVDLVNARIEGLKGSYYVGTVAGYNAGTITDCSARGAVSGHRGYVDQLVGGNKGVIENCYYTAVSRSNLG